MMITKTTEIQSVSGIFAGADFAVVQCRVYV